MEKSELSTTTNLSQIIYQQIDQLFLKYPNERDFWEVMNCYLTKEMLIQNPALSSISIKITVHPNFKIPFSRSSTVLLDSQGERQEFWQFEFKPIQHQKDKNYKISVNYSYKSSQLSGANRNYPDFLLIHQRLETLLTKYKHSNYARSWESISQDLAKVILKEYPNISFLSLNLEK